MAIFSGVLWLIYTLLIPETYALVLLRKRAAALLKRTGQVYKSKSDVEQGTKSIGTAFKTALIRPWLLLFREPIVLLLSLYMTVVYGTLYMLFGAFPIVYQQGRAVGMILATSYSIWDNKRYNKVADASPGGIAPLEARLPPAILGLIVMPIGLFWFAWTNGPSIHWIVSIIASVPFGFSIVLVFLLIMNYLIDAYLIYAASALAANLVL
ncbi:Major facilitator superfamily [Alternaria alternata]|nr:Major facilitator superfamily [Alternaria alternata]